MLIIARAAKQRKSARKTLGGFHCLFLEAEMDGENWTVE